MTILPACSHLNHGGEQPRAAAPSALLLAIQDAKTRCAPDTHLALCNVGIQPQGRDLVLTGEVDSAQTRLEIIQAIQHAGAKVADNIAVLPAAELGDQVYGIASVSVASGREKPGHSSEMGTQVLMGNPVSVLKRSTNWFLVRCSDGYLTWLEKGTFVRRTREQADAWNAAPLLIVNAFEDRILEQPQDEAQPVSDVVTGDLVRETGEAGDWFKVELPDGRAGFLPKKSAEDYTAWKRSRRPTPENIERTARMFLGRPYLWGGNSPKGLDCSGFTKLVFYLNGIDLERNASEQARQGVEVPIDSDLSQLKKGDLLFFGPRARDSRPERVVHVGIYLGEKLFIQASEMVRLSSLDLNSPNADEHRIRTLLHVRRILASAELQGDKEVK